MTGSELVLRTGEPAAIERQPPTTAWWWSLKAGSSAVQGRDSRVAEWQACCIVVLTPRHLLRQLDPSWFFNGQTTSSLESEMEKDEVSEDRGGILICVLQLGRPPPCTCAMKDTGSSSNSNKGVRSVGGRVWRGPKWEDDLAGRWWPLDDDIILIN